MRENPRQSLRKIAQLLNYEQLVSFSNSWSKQRSDGAKRHQQ